MNNSEEDRAYQLMLEAARKKLITCNPEETAAKAGCMYLAGHNFIVPDTNVDTNVPTSYTSSLFH